MKGCRYALNRFVISLEPQVAVSKTNLKTVFKMEQDDAIHDADDTGRI